jgi:hypothetical protein
MSPFTFLGVASFFIGGLFYEPLCVSWGCLFFHRWSFFMSPFVFLGVASFFHWMSFLMSVFAFLRVTSFSSEIFFDEPMNEGFDNTPLFMAPRVCAKALVVCQANLVSHFDTGLT